MSWTDKEPWKSPFLSGSSVGVGVGLGLVPVVTAPWWSTSTDAFLKSWRTWRLRGLGIGVGCGTVFGALFVYYLGADRAEPAIGFIVLPALASALVGGAVAGACVASRPSEENKRRIGHSRAVSLADYVSSPLIWASRVLVIASVTALALQYVIAAQAAPDEPPTVNAQVSAFVVGPALLVLILAEVGARIVIAQPSSAVSVDALRVKTFTEFSLPATASAPR